MEHSGTPSFSSLLRPVHADDILIRGEIVKYDERRHWAILIQPFVETLAVLVVITLIAGSGSGSARAGLTLIAAAGLFMFYRLGKKQWSKALIYAVGGFLLTAFLLSNAETMALLAIIGATGRFAYEALIWLFYERLYITNRRVILARGFLGEEISTMPLTRLTDLNYSTTVPGEILGYASLRLETAGQDQALSWLRFLEKPATFYSTLIDLSTAAVGSITEPKEEPPPIVGEDQPPPPPPPPSPEAHIGTLDEDDGGGTLYP